MSGVAPGGVDPQLVTAGVPIVTAIIAAAVTYITVKVQHKGKPEHALIDQLQEEVRAIREEKAAENAVMRKDIADLKDEQARARRRERKRDNYISVLRRHIDSGQGPPAPDWPEDYDD